MNLTITKKRNVDLLTKDSQDIYRKLIESVECGIYMADNKGKLFFVNQAFVKILGYDREEEVLGLNLSKELYADPKERKEFLEYMKKNGYAKNYVVRNKRKDGSIVYLSATSNYIKSKEGEVLGVEGVVNDITEKLVLEEQLKTEKGKLEEVLGFDEKVSAIRKFDKLIDFVVNKTAKILSAHKCSLMLYDYGSKELCIKGAVGLHSKVVKKTRIKLGESIAGIVAKEGQAVVVKNIDNDKKFGKFAGASYVGRSFISAPIKLHDKLIGVINVSDKDSETDPTFNHVDLKILCDIVREVAVAIENVGLYKELSYLIIIDPITNIYNYRYFTKSLDHEINRTNRFSRNLCLLMMDIDDFKLYNDIYGHQQGDVLLRKLAEVLTQNLRAIDIACRYAEDEFVVILPETNKEGALIVAQKIQKNLAKCRLKKEVTLSIGVAKYNKGQIRHDIVSVADRALYQAKQEGKNKVCVFG